MKIRQLVYGYISNLNSVKLEVSFVLFWLCSNTGHFMGIFLYTQNQNIYACKMVHSLISLTSSMLSTNFCNITKISKNITLLWFLTLGRGQRAIFLNSSSRKKFVERQIFLNDHSKILLFLNRTSKNVCPLMPKIDKNQSYFFH